MHQQHYTHADKAFPLPHMCELVVGAAVPQAHSCVALDQVGPNKPCRRHSTSAVVLCL